MAVDNENQQADGEADAPGFDFETTALVQGVRDFLLRNVRENGMKKPWGKMSEKEQELEINRASEKAEDIINQIVELVAQGDYPVIHAIVDNFKIKAGEVTISAKGIADDEALLTLNHAGQKAVKIVVADPSQFDKQRTHVAADPDEPGLPGVKAEIQPEDLREPGFDDEETQETETFLDEEAEQAEGDQVLGITDHTDQWWGGYNSRMAKHRLDENPFDGRTTNGKEWAAGWKAADENPEAPEVNAEGGDETPPHDPETGEILDDQGGAQSDETPAEPEFEEEPSTPADAPFEEDPHEDDIAQAEETGIANEAPADEEHPEPTDEQRQFERDKGYKARTHGFSPSRNPWAKRNPLHDEWAAGYEKAKEEGQGFED